MKNKIVSTICVLTVATILLSSSFYFVRAEDGITNDSSENKVNTLSLNEQKEQVQEELTKAEEQLEYVQSELTKAVVEIQKMDDRINEYQRQLDEVNSNYKILQENVEKAEQELKLAEEEYNKKYETFSKKLVIMYKKGENTYLDVLLNSKNIIEFVSNYFFIQRITEYDSKILESLGNKKSEIEKINKKLQEDKANMKMLKMQAEKQTVVLTNTKTVYENQKNSLSESENKLNAEIESYKRQQAELENMIKNAILGSTYELKYSGGIMMWPTLESSYITSPYGSRLHPIQGVVKNHSGIDIAGKMADPIYSAADGIVIYSEFNNGGYGNMVMVDHGLNNDGIKVVTLYAHGSKLVKNVGDTVKKGDIIMEVGSTGNSTGPHLHFEVRENGVAVDPKGYLASNQN